MKVKKATVVKTIAVLDVIFVILSFGLLLTMLYMMGDSVAATKLIVKDLKTTDKEEVLFRWVFIGMIVFFALIIHTLQVLMATVLYKAANKMKEDHRTALKGFGRWRAWSVILLVFMLTGAVTLVFVFNDLKAWWCLVFLGFEITFQILAIIYIGHCAQSIDSNTPQSSVNLEILYSL